MPEEDNDVTDFTPAAAQEAMLDTLMGIWDDFIEHLPLLGFGLLALLLTWLVARGLSTIFQHVLRKRETRGSLVELVGRLVSVVIWVLGLLIAAMLVFPGLTPTKALGGLGVVSIAVGFAFQDIFENFFAGILLLWKFPFEKGDYISCEGIEGEVKDITVRMTMIRKTTDEMILVPNSFLFKNPVRVLTYKNKRRLTIMTGVAYDVNLEDAVEVIRKTMQQCATVDNDHEPQIFANGFGSSSMDIEVTWWTDPTPFAARKSVSEVVIAIKKALDEAGMEIPFPYRTLTFKEPLPLAHTPSPNNPSA